MGGAGLTVVGLPERSLAAHGVPADASALAAGGHLVSDEHAPEWWTLADAEGNEVDVTTTTGRD
jgi:hypothetical protein